MSPKISVIISAYNAEKYLNETLNSVFKQTWKNLEVILVNDGSCDTTKLIAEKYATKNLIILNQNNLGQDAALNAGYKISTGEYVKFLDSDDVINSEMIQLQIEALNNSTEYIAYSEWDRFYNDNIFSASFEKRANWKDMSPIDFLTSEPIAPMLQCGTMLIPRQLIEKAGLWDVRLILFNDTEYFIRLLLKSKGIKFSHGAKLYYRSGLSNSISVQKSRKYFDSTFLATSLIAVNLLNAENSLRTNQLIANMYFNQYFEMYPNFNDLLKKHKKCIKEYGGSSLIPKGGTTFEILKFLFGWKISKLFQLFAYKLGYNPNRIF